MRQSLVSLLACPSCVGPLVCSSRNDIVSSGVLTCACGRWFPIEQHVPELLPDHLRDWDKDVARFDALAAGMDDDQRRALSAFRPDRAVDADPGSHYKKAEIGIKSKVDEPMFFVPGETLPFAPWDPHFSLYLIKLFGVTAPLLNLKRDEIVIDSGCGYAWTTEWLFRSGFNAIGVDICRTYLEIAARRIGPSRPHLVVADIEHLPFASSMARAVFVYESFHHIPNRPRALGQFHRVLHHDGVVILAEPGAAHEAAKVSVDAMAKYGILEKGMELADVRAYAGDTTFSVEQLFVLRLGAHELGAGVDAAFVGSHSIVEGNLFRLIKGQRSAVPVPNPAAPVESKGHIRGLVSRLKGRLKTNGSRGGT